MKRIPVAVALVAALAAAAAGRNVTDDNATLTHDCDKDPTLDVLANHATVELTGTCYLVSLDGNFATVHGKAKRITIKGNDNTVAADAVGALDVVGNRNAVTWKAGINGDPRVSNLGHDNTITRAK
jgi:phosphate-selective porin